MNDSIKVHNRLMNELRDIANDIRPWYDIDKIKFDSVYIWTKGEYGQNVFDIGTDKIYYYVDDHVIPEEAWPAIHKIQVKLRENQNYVYEHADDFPNGKWLKAQRDNGEG